MMRTINIAILFLFIFSCSIDKVSYNYPDNPDYARNMRAGLLFSEHDLTLVGKNQKPNKKKNIWDSSINIIGELFPISNIDEKSKIITTDWYQDDSNGKKRVKINAFIYKDGELDSLKIILFRQIKVNNEWQDLNKEDSAMDGSVANILWKKILNN